MEDYDEEEVYAARNRVVVARTDDIVSPMLSSLDRKSLVSFMKQREKYEVDVGHYARRIGAEVADIQISIRERVAPELMRVLSLYEIQKPAESITDDDLLLWIQAKLNTNKLTSTALEACFKKRLKMDLSIRDVDTRIMAYFQLAHEIVEEYGFKDRIGALEPKNELFCHFLVEGLVPEELRHEVRVSLKLTENKSARKMPTALYQLVKMKAQEQQALHDHSRFVSSKRQASDASQHNRRGGRSGGEEATRDTKRPKNDRPVKPEGQQNKPVYVHLSGCLKCGKEHKLNDHPGITQDEKKALWEKFHDLKGKSDARGPRKPTTNKRALFSSLNDCLQSELSVVLNGCHKMSAIADSGATGSPCISRKNLLLIQQKDPNVRPRQLPKPIMHLTTGGYELTSTEVVPLRITIHTVSGPVATYKPFDCFIVEEDEDDFLISRPILQSLGIDVEAQLNSIAQQLNDRPDIQDNDLHEKDADQLDLGPELDFEALNLALNDMVEVAILNGFPQSKVGDLTAIIRRYDIWRVKFRGSDGPAHVRPLEVMLKEGEAPYACKQRNYNSEECQFMEEFNASLVHEGVAKAYPTSRWASRALPIRKRSAKIDGEVVDKYRQTVDYVVVNSKCVPMAGHMPRPDVVLEHARGMQFHGVFDFVSGFWQIPLKEESQEILAYRTHRRIYTTNRMPQGFVDSALYFQSVVEQELRSILPSNGCVWIDDILLFARNVDEYLHILDKVFAILHSKNFKLSAMKCTLFGSNIRWCGRIITQDGIVQDQEKLLALHRLPLPKSAGDLMQFICAANWLRCSIPDFARIMAPLQEKLNKSLAGRKRTKRIASGLLLDWCKTEANAFKSAKDAILGAAELHFVDPNAEICLFTDASDDGWSIIVTQVVEWDHSILAHEQNHQLIACQSGCFTGSQLFWSVIDKEAYPIAHACTHLEYVLMRAKGFQLFAIIET